MAKITFLSFYSDYSIGVYVLSNILQNCGHDVSIIYFKLPSKEPIKWFTEDPSNYEMVDTSGEIVGFNADVNHWTDNEVTLLTDKILELSPDLLCISSRCTDKELVLDILPKIKSRCSVMMIAGGFGPSIEPELYLNLVDYVYRGEAENMILKIVSAVENGRSLSRMDNMCYKKDGKIIYKKLCLPEIDQFKYQSVPVNTYYIEDDSIFNSKKGEILSSSIAGIKTHSYSTFVGRGCINTCSYCSALEWNKMYAREGIRIKKRRNRPLEDVIEELKSIKDNAYTFVQFRDEFLFADIKYLKRFFYLYEREICLPFWAYLVPQQVSDHPELLKMAVDAGLVATEVGFQSGSGEINRNIFTRYMTNRKFVEYAKLLEHYNINIKYDFIICNPAETSNHILSTIELIQSLPKKRCYLQLARLKYFPKSPIIDILKEYENCTSDFGRYYCTALIYLLSFVLSKREFDTVLKDANLVSSWQGLKNISWLCRKPK